MFEKRGGSEDESSSHFPLSGPQMGNDLLPALGTAPSQDNVQSTSGTPPQHNPLPESGNSQSHNEPPATPHDMPPGSGTPESQNDLTSGAPALQDDQPTASGLPPSDNDQSSTSETLPLHNELSLTSSSQSSSLGEPELPNGPSAASEDPQLHDDHSPLHINWQSDPIWQELYTLYANQRAPPSPAPEAHTFFNDALKQKLRTYAGYGLIAGVSAVLTLGVEKLIKSNSHGAYVSAFFPPSPTDIQPITIILTYDYVQSTLWQGSCK